MSRPGPPRQPGTRIIRVPQVKPERIEIQHEERRRPGAPAPALVLVAGFAGLIALGTLLLMLPISSARGIVTAPLDALFTATSAVCVTGLVVADTGTYWSLFGQVVILALIQIGGLGFMTGATLIWLAFGRRVSLQQRLVIRATLGTFSLAGLEWLVLRIILVTAALELIGAALLGLRLLAYYPPATAAWYGLFHSVSAFNNAGFDLFGDFRSVTIFAGDPFILLPIAFLILLGGTGASTLGEIRRARGFQRLSVDSKLVVLTTAALLVGGSAAIYFLERQNPDTLGSMSLGAQALNAFFHAVSPRTAGFNSLDISALTDGSIAITIVLMFIGTAPGSTGGGIKLTTFSVLLAAIIATVRGRNRVDAFHREIPHEVVYRALTVALLAVAVVMAATITLTITEGGSLTLALFEATSAFGTVGLTAGLTSVLSPVGKVVLSLVMFAGRLGPLTLALALVLRQDQPRYRNAQEQVRIG